MHGDSKGYLLFLAGLMSLGKPYLAINARALSTFFIIKGELLTSDKVGSTIMPGKFFPVVVLDIRNLLVKFTNLFPFDQERFIIPALCKGLWMSV